VIVFILPPYQFIVPPVSSDEGKEVRIDMRSGLYW